MSSVDYRDRVSILVWVTLMGLAAQRLLILPARSFTMTLFGSPVTFTLTSNTMLALLLAGLVASGAEAVIRAHPRSFIGELGSHWTYWALPVALIVVAVLTLPVAPSRLYWLLGLVITGALLGLSLAGVYYTVDPFATGYRRARLALNALTYTVALLLFLVVYRTRVRSIVSATEVMVVTTLLALELLRGSERPMLLVTLYAGIAGLVLGQATWALNYWRLDSLTGGLLLLLVFYNFVGLSQHALQGQIRRRIVLEYALISIAALALMWEFAP